MKLILYYSGTGNSMHVAQTISRQLKDNDMAAILHTDSIDWCQYTQLILVYPVYMNHLPAPVQKKLIELKLPFDLPTTFVATHGGYEGVAGANAVGFTVENNINLIAYFSIKTVNNTPKGVAPKFLMQLEWEEDLEASKLEKKLNDFNLDIGNVIKSIELDECGLLTQAKEDIHKLPYKTMKLANKLLGSKPAKLNFLLDDACTGCGVCEKVCLTNRIRVVKGKASWIKDECYYCYACFNYCPEQAIGVKHYTKKLGRYHYPDISFLDISKQK